MTYKLYVRLVDTNMAGIHNADVGYILSTSEAVEYFSPIDTTDEPALANRFEVMRGSHDESYLRRKRRYKADILAKEIADKIVEILERQDKHNGYSA